MRYRLDIFGTTDTTPVTSIDSPDITIRRWSKRINAPGVLTFAIQASNTKATEENLRIFRRVRLLRRRQDGLPGYLRVWSGYIEEVTQFGDEIEVECAGMLKFFRKRWATRDQSLDGDGTALAFDLLDVTNADDGETGVLAGDGGVSTSRNVRLNGDVDILKAWELWAAAHQAEFEIDDDFEFNFVSLLGSDKSGTVTLEYRTDGQPGSNVQSIRIGESGFDMATQIVLRSTASGGITSTYDSPNQVTYGVLVDKRSFNEAQDQTTLDAIRDALGSQLENPLTDFSIVPELATKELNVRTMEREMKGLSYDVVSVGDLIMVKIYSENRTIPSEVKRVVEIRMDVDEEGLERMSLTLSQAGVFITAGYLDASRVFDLTRRVKQIESVLS